MYLVNAAGCHPIGTIELQRIPTAVLWKASAPHLLIVGMADGTFTTTTINESLEVTIGPTYRTGGLAHISAFAMDGIHKILAVATGPLVHIYRFEPGDCELTFPITFDHLSTVDHGPTSQLFSRTRHW